MWGYEEPDSELSLLDEPFDRTVGSSSTSLSSTRARGADRRAHDPRRRKRHAQRHGTMVVVESVVMQRNLGPNRFCGGQAPVTDYDQPNTYAPNPDWPACKLLVEHEYRRMLGVKKVIWVPTGVVEDNGTFRGALAPHIRVPNVDGIDIPHAGVYTMFTTNGHPDEYSGSSRRTRSCWLRRRCQGRRPGRLSTNSSAGSRSKTTRGSSGSTRSSPGRRRSLVSQSRLFAFPCRS